MKTYRHDVLASVLAAEIQEGKYAVGEKIPTEQALQRRFDAGRHTVREALRTLKERGVLVSRAGIGTVVRARPASRPQMQGTGTLRELIQFAEARRMRLLDSQECIADQAMQQELGVPAGQQCVQIRFLRAVPEEDRPVAYVSMLLRPEHRGIVARIDQSSDPVHRMIEREYDVRIAEVRQSIVPALLQAEVAGLLAAPAGMPCLRITRQFLDAQDRLVCVSVGIYPQDRFSHDTVFRVQHDGAGGTP
ncbi:GntR family transcriptional regulator [Orrella sp. JC864]|uniref:GntR family transcriptional regulator n=1 Tax=Orrella sp. JC864 TaxID=3120298 RepID=UPI00300929F9